MFNIRFVAAVVGEVGEEEEVCVRGCLVSVLQRCLCAVLCRSDVAAAVISGVPSVLFGWMCFLIDAILLISVLGCLCSPCWCEPLCRWY